VLSEFYPDNYCSHSCTERQRNESCISMFRFVNSCTVKELLQLEFFAEDTGIRVDLVRPDVDASGDVIQLQLHVTHARRRGLQQRENEAVQFSYNIVSDNPDAVAHEMVCYFICLNLGITRAL
jgi:WNK lysine deficient protein kinase